MVKKTQKRVNESIIYSSFESSRVTALLGARRVGKTTLLKSYMSLHPDRKWVFLNMDLREERLRIENQEFKWMIEEGALTQIGKGEKIWVAIDEAQKCPALFDQMKELYDTHKDQGSIKFILTGSGHLNLHQLAAESLAGRVELIPLREFNLKEMASAIYPDISMPDRSVFDLILGDPSLSALREIHASRSPFCKILTKTLPIHLIWGGLPEVLEEKETQGKKRYLANYLQTYLENDIRAIGSISDLNLYQKLIQISAEQTGSVRDDGRLLSALGCARNTLIKYRGYLINTMQYEEVYPYVNSTLKRVVKSPKGYLINNGLISYLTGIHDESLLHTTGLIGHRFENWLLNELLTWTDSVVDNHAIYFWRTRGGKEVDFVLSTPLHIIPIEVTFSNQRLPKKMRHLKDFIQEEPKANVGLYIYNGEFKIDEEDHIIYLPTWMI